MLVATFGTTTAWTGRKITFEDNVFALEGHGPVTAVDVMEYDRLGHLVWPDAGTRAWVGAKARVSSATQIGHDMPAAASTKQRENRTATASPDQDRVALALRNLGHSADVRLGAISGAAVLCMTWFGTFLLGLIPVRVLGIALLSPASRVGDPFNSHWWVVWSLLGHFGGRAWVRLGTHAGVTELSRGIYGMNLTGLVPLAIFIGVMWLVGLYVRRMAAPSVRTRLTILVIAAATMALVAGIVALLGGFAIGGNGDAYTVGFGAFSSVVRAFVITTAVGAFSFGVVGLLPVPHAAALQNSARFAVIPVLLVALFAPFVVAAKLSADAGSTNRDFVGVGTLAAPAAGAAIVPMSFGSQGTYGVVAADSGGLYTPGDVSHSSMTTVLRSLYSGRMFALADRLGTVVKFIAFALLIGVLAFWVYTVRGYLGVMGAPTGAEGLKAGAFLGLESAVAVLLLASLLTLKIDFAGSYLTEDAAAAVTGRSAMGITGASYPYVLLMLTVTGAGIGYLVGTLRPSPTRYAMSGVIGLAHHETPATPAQIPPTIPLLAAEAGDMLSARSPDEESGGAASADAPAGGASAAPSANGVADEIAKLASLHAMGSLTDEEFAAAKRRLLD